MKKITCRPVETEEELRACYAIRKKVFVDEQKIFKGSDIDEYDRQAIHIAAYKEKAIVGTVRVYLSEKYGWVGSRLAVLKGFEKDQAGILLVRKAVKIVEQKGAKRFIAWVQVKNVKFFIRLGWKPVGEIVIYRGRPHQVMEAKLKNE